MQTEMEVELNHVLHAMSNAYEALGFLPNYMEIDPNVNIKKVKDDLVAAIIKLQEIKNGRP